MGPTVVTKAIYD
jgi:hypothetical protein